jgi:hypothetical protein
VTNSLITACTPCDRACGVNWVLVAYLALVRARGARVKQALFRGAEMLRKYTEHLHVDRLLYNDHNAMKKLVKSGEIVIEVEKVVGGLY